MDTTPTGPESGSYKLYNIGVQEFATEGYIEERPKDESAIVMVSVKQDIWVVTKLHDGKYTIQAPSGKYSFIHDPPKEGEIVELRRYPPYEWFIVIVSWTSNHLPICRIYTKTPDNENIYWRAKLINREFTGVVYLSTEIDDRSLWLFDNMHGFPGNGA